ncbi:MAG: hypothetical protein F6K31_01130 [Symploca sp. SIO2G7]|nr:hypothetical protein [Symploca sp. SIO2G7]
MKERNFCQILFPSSFLPFFPVACCQMSCCLVSEEPRTKERNFSVDCCQMSCCLLPVACCLLPIALFLKSKACHKIWKLSLN